ncbi:isoprenoid synthase domain-containing protein [Mycena galopus ATCC 62051]|nr:isoprenoid synthase domain-containing protein [Mycena galopus ATCC 62051]
MTPCDDAVSEKFLNAGNFELCAALLYPECDVKHLETGLGFLLWLFAADDVFDDASASTEEDCNQHERHMEASLAVLRDPEAATTDPYSMMFQDVVKRLKSTATKGNFERFFQGYLIHQKATIEQSRFRSLVLLPSIEEFVHMRRGTISGNMCLSTVEYALDIDLPDHVFDDPVLKGMSFALHDIMAWPNDLYSFNKEQAQGDFENLVCVVMAEKNLGVQDSVDFVGNMLGRSIAEYAELKQKLPSFGPQVDAELTRYLTGCEFFTQGALRWYSSSLSEFLRQFCISTTF